MAYRIDNETRLLDTKLDILCSYTAGNPSKTNLKWQHGNLSVGEINSAHLIIENITKLDEGWYTCKVFNTIEPTGCVAREGVSESSFYLDVQCRLYKACIDRC